MQPHLKLILEMVIAATLLLVAAGQASAQSDRFVGVRKDVAGDIVLVSIEALTGAERRIASLHKAGSGVTLLGPTAINARKGTFSYAYTEAGKDYLHTVSFVTGQSVAKVALPADVAGLEAVTDGAAARAADGEVERDALRRRIEVLEQEVRRLQTQTRR